MNEKHYTILLVEDEDNDATLLKMAFKMNNIPNPIQWAKDGAEAVAYLNGEGVYSNRELYPFPEVLIIDIKMPRMTGLELLAWMRDNSFRVIPSIVMTSSRQDTDIEKAYELGANTYMIKPSSFNELQAVVKVIHDYWTLAIRPPVIRPA